MTTVFKTIKDIIYNKEECPIDIGVFPNYMGINLCSVYAVSWQRQDDGQLVNLQVYFIPSSKPSNKEKINEYLNPLIPQVDSISNE